MSSKTKIVVFKMKELIYTAIFAGLGILLIILLIYMFFPSKKEDKSVSANIGAESSEVSYIPGVYNSSMVLNGQNIDVSVTVDSDHINSIQFKNLNESVTTMFPLIEPALDELSKQICEKQTLDGITYSDDTKFTSQALMKTIRSALDKAQIVEEK